ncbi:MAG: hypothetical protein RhofKO_26960 [Rhodothermales bacterium]
MLLNAILDALANLLILGLIPFGLYATYHKVRHKRTISEITQRAGLQRGDLRYMGYAAGLALLVVIGLIIWPPSVETMGREGSAFRDFVGLGLTPTSIAMALIYGVVKTGLAEEFLFRGLIAGSLARRLPEKAANITQALIFLLPHLLILTIAPDLWPMLIIVLVGAYVSGWLRIRSESILAPWLLHAVANVTNALLVAMQ